MQCCLATQGLANAIQFEPPAIQRMVSALLDLSVETLFITVSIKEMVWGYNDGLLKLAGKIFPSWFYTSQVGVLSGVRNGSCESC